MRRTPAASQFSTSIKQKVSNKVHSPKYSSSSILVKCLYPSICTFKSLCFLHYARFHKTTKLYPEGIIIEYNKRLAGRNLQQPQYIKLVKIINKLLLYSYEQKIDLTLVEVVGLGMILLFQKRMNCGVRAKKKTRLLIERKECTFPCRK